MAGRVRGQAGVCLTAVGSLPTIRGREWGESMIAWVDDLNSARPPTTTFRPPEGPAIAGTGSGPEPQRFPERQRRPEHQVTPIGLGTRLGGSSQEPVGCESTVHL